MMSPLGVPSKPLLGKQAKLPFGRKWLLGRRRSPDDQHLKNEFLYVGGLGWHTGGLKKGICIAGGLTTRVQIV
jgi:hypothetical protein